jgi:hypothetical protein
MKLSQLQLCLRQANQARSRMVVANIWLVVSMAAPTSTPLTIWKI